MSAIKRISDLVTQLTISGELGGGEGGRHHSSMQSLSPGDPTTTWRAWRVLVPVQLRPTSGPGVLPRAPTCAVLARPCKLKKMQNCPRRRDISARRGPRTRRRGIVMPLRGCIFKTFVQISYVKSAFIFTFSAKFVILIKLVLPNLRF